LADHRDIRKSGITLGLLEALGLLSQKGTFSNLVVREEYVSDIQFWCTKSSWSSDLKPQSSN